MKRGSRKNPDKLWFLCDVIASAVDVWCHSLSCVMSYLPVPRLPGPLPAGLPVLWASLHVLGGGGVSGVRRGRGRLLRGVGGRRLLLLRGGGVHGGGVHGGGVHGGGVPGGAGLWDPGGLLLLLRLHGDLPGVLRHLLPLLRRPIREGLVMMSPPVSEHHRTQNIHHYLWSCCNKVMGAFDNLSADVSSSCDVIQWFWTGPASGPSALMTSCDPNQGTFTTSQIYWMKRSSSLNQR